MAIYRPSETKAWLKCPVARSLEYLDGWTPRTLGRKHLSAILGTGVHAGVAVYHKAHREGATPDLALSQTVAVDAVRKELEAYASLGCVIRPEEMPFAESLEAKAAKGVAQYIARDPITTQGWSVRHVEQKLENYGGCTIDLGVETPLGLAVADVKTRGTLKEDYRQKTKSEYAVDWQLRHYAWAYGQYMGQPVSSYYIIFVVLEPFSLEVWDYTLQSEDMIAWRSSAREVWARMEYDAEYDDTWQNLTACWSSFGPCDFMRACHVDHYEESLMRHNYVRRTK